MHYCVRYSTNERCINMFLMIKLQIKYEFSYHLREHFFMRQSSNSLGFIFPFFDEYSHEIFNAIFINSNEKDNFICNITILRCLNNFNR